MEMLLITLANLLFLPLGLYATCLYNKVRDGREGEEGGGRGKREGGGERERGRGGRGRGEGGEREGGSTVIILCNMQLQGEVDKSKYVAVIGIVLGIVFIMALIGVIIGVSLDN